MNRNEIAHLLGFIGISIKDIPAVPADPNVEGSQEVPASKEEIPFDNTEGWNFYSKELGTGENFSDFTNTITEHDAYATVVGNKVYIALRGVPMEGLTIVE